MISETRTKTARTQGVKVGDKKMKTYVLRTETVRIHGGQSRTRCTVYLVRDNESEPLSEPGISKREAQKIAAKEARSYGCKIKVDHSAVGVQYAHQM